MFVRLQETSLYGIPDEYQMMWAACDHLLRETATSFCLRNYAHPIGAVVKEAAVPKI